MMPNGLNRFFFFFVSFSFVATCCVAFGDYNFCATLSFALRERGFRSISSLPGTIGLPVMSLKGERLRP